MSRHILLFACLLGLVATFGRNLFFPPVADGVLRAARATAPAPPPPTDTLPPLRDRYGDFINDGNSNLIDLDDPAAVEQTVEYDPATDRYIVRERIGDFDFRPPTYLTFDEYLTYRRQRDQQAYFDQLAGVRRTGGLSVDDPLADVDVESDLLDRLFGGNTIDIRPQGSIDLTFGVDHQRLDNPILTERQRSTTIFDFDMDIQMNVTGKIGEKLTLTTNYNTGATFNFDRQLIKLDYNSDLFSEDDIIKKIEAGNVSLPLRGSLIQGAQSLFGLKTELQFGHLRLTGIASMQQSQRENITIKGGSQVQEFEVRADEYDENRHFFLSHYNRAIYEPALNNLPQINTLFHLENMEVWITNDRNEFTDVRDIVALSDLGEPERLTNPQRVTPTLDPRFREIGNGRFLPENGANDLYSRLVNRGEAIREIDQAVAILESEFGLQQARDFEKISARKLNPREYTVHPELGFVSLNINVQPDQVVGVSFRYKYNGQILRVGELSTITDDVSADTTNLTSRVLFVKMLKSTTQRVGQPTWDLMMKNVYSLGAYQIGQEDFRLDVVYDDPGGGFKRFLPETNLEGIPLIRVFNLDELNTQGDPFPDGIFDFVPGLTINPQNGRIYFPKLEPFGSYLAEQIEDSQLERKYVYQELYDSTRFRAQEFPEKNRFVITGTYKSSVSSEISLGAFNIPPGSVRVTAGGALLIEGRDYEVDYSTGRVRILNDAILSSGVPVNVSFEDNTLFGFQQKTMLGVRADYEVSDNLNVGATFLQLLERPFTQKVNILDDPINNKIYGLDVTYNQESPFITRLVDKLPFYSSAVPSNISFTAETAYLNPGHSRAINQSRRDDGGFVYIDDFEGSASPIDVSQPVNRWFLASVPRNDAANSNPLFPEYRVGDLQSGANRALLNWYRLDPTARGPNDDDNPYTSLVPRQEVFPNASFGPQQQQLFNFQTFDLSYYPEERGPYNFDTPDGIPGLTAGVTLESSDENQPVKLRRPDTRWGGIMRALTTQDFQTANIEFVEFWMLSPFLNEQDAFRAADDVDQKEGTLYLNLGNISEDILPDSRKFFENGLPGPANLNRPVDTTTWGRIPVGQQITRAFDNDLETRRRQDVGLDGLDDQGEQQFFRPYLNRLEAENPVAASQVAADPANDNFRYYNDGNYSAEDGVRQRYLQFNNVEGNSSQQDGNQFRQAGTNIPDAEDINQDNTLNESEAYFQYEIPLRYNPVNPREIDPNTPFITDRLEAENGRIWYRFRVPVNTPLKKSVGGIQDFRSIRFMRLYMREFEAPTILRFARFELVRNQWRRYTRDFRDASTPPPISGQEDTDFSVDAVNFEENSNRIPFNYVLPLGVQREQALGAFTALQNEQSLALRVDNLYRGDRRAVFKYTDVDLRLYERLRMFVHAEERNGRDRIQDGDLSVFIRLGSDFENNYYEYEIPLILSDLGLAERLDPTSLAYQEEVWRLENEFNFPLEILRNLKQDRNDLGVEITQEFERTYEAPNSNNAEHVIRVKGNPNLGFVKVMMIGVKNRGGVDADGASVEIWANELRAEGLDERGGVAALARMDVQLADLGNLTLAGNFSSIGFGALDDRVHDRARERTMGYDVATNLQLGKFFPQNWGIRLPFYAQVSNVTSTPEYDPYDFDIRLKDKVEKADNQTVRDSLREQAQEITNITSINFTNVGKDRTGPNANKPKPWDVENLSVSYAYTKTESSDPFIQSQDERQHTAAIDYTYTRPVVYFEPFKGIESKYLRLIKEFNVNLLPNSFSFTNIFDRTRATTSYRFAGVDERFNTFYNNRFLWNRNYDLQWDLTRSLKIGYNASNNATIDEPYYPRIQEDPSIADPEKYARDSIWEGLKDFGRPKFYQQAINVSYTLPLRYLPFMDWVQVRAQYQGGYNWNAAALNVDTLGNVIQNNQNRQVTADLNFERFYDQFSFLQKINRPRRPNNQRGRQGPTTPTPKEEPEEAGKKKRSGEPSAATRALVRPLLMLRRARFTYSEQFATVLPGFLPAPNLMGLSPGFNEPGWDFVFGLQPRIGEQYWNTDQDWLAQKQDVLTNSLFLNQDVSQVFTRTLDAQVTVEPIQDFRIDLSWNRNRQENYTETFKVIDFPAPGDPVVFEHAVPTYGGSLTTTYSALRTMFLSDTAAVELFNTFSDYRRTVSQRLGDTPHQDPDLAERGYTDGYGPNQQDVLLPAFIAAYTGQDPGAVSLNIFDVMTRPNWRITYNGLNKIGNLRDVFSTFSISHGFQGTFTVNNYRTSLDFLASLRTEDPRFDTVSLNFYPRIDIPDVLITEAFAPLFALEATLMNGMSFNFDYKQARTLGLSVTSKILSETRSKEIVGGFGYVMRGVNIGFLTGSRNPRPTQDETQQGGQPQPPNRRGGAGRSGGRLQVQDLDMQFNFSLRDDITLARKLDQEVSEPTRGTYAISFSPSAEYQLNQRLSLRAFVDYRRTIPKNTLGYPQTTASGGMVVRFQLN